MTDGKNRLPLGDRIKSEIKEKKLNSSAIARAMGVAPQTVNQVDLRKSFSFEFLQKLKFATGGVIDYVKEATEFESNSDTLLKEPKEYYGKSDVDLSFNISVRTDRGSIGKLGLLMDSFAQTAKNLGFEFNY